MSSCKRREILQRILELSCSLDRVSTTLQNEGVEIRPTVRTTTVGRRVVFPGQILRFPDQESWEWFKTDRSIPETAFEIIKYTDPLGFDPDSRIYDDASENPKNYLQRNQLPPLHIDMTNVYDPSITAEYDGLDVAPGEFMPFLACSGDRMCPALWTFNPPGTTAELLTPDDVGVEEIISSYVPRLFTSEEELVEYMNQNQETWMTGMKAVAIVSFASDLLGRMVANSASGITINIPQPDDCSQQSVGCFWFNDGKKTSNPRGQIELPKDPRCKTSVLVKFKSWMLI